MPCEVSPHLTIYHIYAIEDPKNVKGALCGGQPIVHKEVSSNPTHGDFHPAFYECDHQNHYQARRFIYNQPFAQLTVLEFNTVRDPILSPKGSHAFGGVH